MDTAEKDQEKGGDAHTTTKEWGEKALTMTKLQARQSGMFGSYRKDQSR